jgi:phenylalanyl-tRNA synthetase beta chain
VRFSYSWLTAHVELPPLGVGAEATLLALADDLTAVGLAVEGRELLPEGDAVLDIDVTSNRPDCMNHRGVAREIAVKRNLKLREPVSSFTESFPAPGASTISIAVDDPEGCPRFTARVIRGVKIGPSPEWLVRRLEAIGLRSINNVVDATNYVLWETGQPLHAYDLATIPNGEMRVRRGRAGESLVTLDGKERKLDPDVLVIADRSRPIGLAGIMGGLDTEVTPATSDLLLEAAHFDRRRTRIGAKRLGMHTDASHRFERGADLGACDDASRRCAALIVEIAGGTIEAGAVDLRGPRPEPVRWRLSGPEVERFGGAEIPDGEIERILAGLGFAPRRVGERLWEGEVPSWREVDFEPRKDRLPKREAWHQDLYEEVLRQFGFDRIPATLPVIEGIDAGENPEHDRRERLRDLLAGLGYAETIHYAFGKRSDDAALPKLAGHGDPIALANPLSELYAVMRRSLVPNLVVAAEYNANRGASGVRLFESGHLFPGGEAAEIEALAMVSGGVQGGPWDRRPESDLLALKGEVEVLVGELGAAPDAAPAELPGIVPGTGALWTIAGETVGWLGRVATAGTPFPLFAAELRLDRLPVSRERIRVEAPSRFPGIEVDLTLTHALTVAWSEIARAIRDRRVEELRSFALKDRYQGDGVPAGAVATTVTFHYVSAERSLTQDEVNARHAALAEALAARFGVDREGKS